MILKENKDIHFMKQLRDNPIEYIRGDQPEARNLKVMDIVYKNWQVEI